MDLMTIVRAGTIANMRKLAPANPVGAGNSKTGVPSTYRPVGATCPLSCPLLGSGCYADGGNVALHQRRASADLAPSVQSAAIAMVSARMTGTQARLHVSGDYAAPGGAVDTSYIDALCALGPRVTALAPGFGPWVAWAYTHFARADFGPYATRLLSAGIATVYSGDTVGAGHAIIAPPSALPSGRAAGCHVVACPAQHGPTTCATCGGIGKPNLCIRAGTGSRLCIAFEAHGSAAARARKVATHY